jgi:hypothetical protein
MWMGGQRHAPVALPPVKRSGTYFTGGWVVDRLVAVAIHFKFHSFLLKEYRIQVIEQNITFFSV